MRDCEASELGTSHLDEDQNASQHHFRASLSAAHGHLSTSSPPPLSLRSVQCGLLVPRDLVYCIFTRYRESEPQPNKFSPPGHPGTFCACPWPLRLLSSALVLSDASSARNCLSHLPRGSSVPSFSGHFNSASHIGWSFFACLISLCGQC